MEYYAAGRKKGLLPFPTAWMDLDSIMLSEMSQAVKDKYHMISPISGTPSTKQTSEQNLNRNLELKNKLTVIGREMGGDIGGVGGKGRQGKCIKDSWTKPKVGKIHDGRRGWLGRWGVGGGGGNGDNCT